MRQWPAIIRKLPPLEALRVLEVVVDSGGFAKAAERLNLTPNAVAHQIGKLEQWYGIELFHRLPRGVTAAADVERFAVEIKRVFDDLRKVSDGFVSQRTSTAVTISAMPSLVTKWLLPRLGQLRSQRPSVEYRVVATPVLADVEREDIDIVIREGTGPWSGINTELIFSEWWAPVCSKGYAEDNQLRNTNDLTRVDVLHDEPWDGTPFQVMWNNWCLDYNLKEGTGRNHLQFSHSYLSIEAAIAGQGVALGNLALIADDIQAERLIAPVGEWKRSQYDFYLGRANNTVVNSSVDEVYRWLVNAAKNHSIIMDEVLSIVRVDD